MTVEDKKKEWRKDIKKKKKKKIFGLEECKNGF